MNVFCHIYHLQMKILLNSNEFTDKFLCMCTLNIDITIYWKNVLKSITLFIHVKYFFGNNSHNFCQ